MATLNSVTLSAAQLEVRFPTLFATHAHLIPAPEQISFRTQNPRTLELLHQLPQRGLAIVGTRYPTDRSVSLLRKWIRDLRGSDLILISGLAQGIDAVVHEEALAANLATVALLGHGLNHIYPAGNRSLYEKIAQNAQGILVSEFDADQGPLPWQFLLRNRLIAAWSQATLVVEAPEKSGTLNTARWARDLGRNLYTIPAWPEDRKFRGNQQLLDEHHAQACWGIHSLGSTWLEFASWNTSKKAKHSAPQLGLIPFVEKHATMGEGIDPLRLIDLAVEAGWSESDAFRKLQEHLKNNDLLDRRGLVLINLPSSV